MDLLLKLAFLDHIFLLLLTLYYFGYCRHCFAFGAIKKKNSDSFYTYKIKKIIDKLRLILDTFCRPKH